MQAILLLPSWCPQMYISLEMLPVACRFVLNQAAKQRPAGQPAGSGGGPKAASCSLKYRVEGPGSWNIPNMVPRERIIHRHDQKFNAKSDFVPGSGMFCVQVW